jgi:four helix bundle protein
MTTKTFEEMIVWQKAKVLSSTIYKQFRDSKDYSFRDQIQRASVSIMNNIAEGFERKGEKELKYFLFIAKGSCGEVRSMIHLALDLKYISNQQFNDLYKSSTEISKMLAGFIKSV